MLTLRVSRYCLLAKINPSLRRQISAKNHCKRHASMSSWKVSNSLDDSNEVAIRDKLKLLEVRIPTISSPSDVLVKVHSTSVNPLDVRMCRGYGRRVLDLLDMVTNSEPRITNDRYPLTLGRDFSGEIVAVGPSAKNLKQGDMVFGAVDPQRSGAHAEYVTVSSRNLTRKPENISHQEAASIPFVALTAYSAICTFGGLSEKTCNGKSVLVLGGSGGVGAFAIQLLKLWGANVVATCSESKIDYLENTLLVDQAIDYMDLSQMSTLKGRFDFVLDCGDYDSISKSNNDIIKDGTQLLKPYNQSVYVTLSPPILQNTDQHGMVLGMASTAFEAVRHTLIGLRNLNSARWAVFLPNKSALDYISSLYEDQALIAQVHSVFAFDHLPEAYEELQAGSVRGKVIVDVMRMANSKTDNTTSENESTATSADPTSKSSLRRSRGS